MIRMIAHRFVRPVAADRRGVQVIELGMALPLLLTLSLGGDSAAPEDAASTVFSRGLAANGSGKPA